MHILVNCHLKVTHDLHLSLSNYSSGGFSNKSSLNDSGVVGDQEMDTVSEDKLRLQVRNWQVRLIRLKKMKSCLCSIATKDWRIPKLLLHYRNLHRKLLVFRTSQVLVEYYSFSVLLCPYWPSPFSPSAKTERIQIVPVLWQLGLIPWPLGYEATIRDHHGLPWKYLIRMTD